MPEIRINIDRCPCGSGRVISNCCLKPIGRLPKQPVAAFRRDGCYAASLNDCAGKISREHWLTRNILQEIQAGDHTVRVFGFPWQNQEEWKNVGIEGLSANTLCQRHNAALSKLDNLAGRFFRGFPHMKPDKPSLQLFNGFDLERWMMKVLCGGIAGGNIRGRERNRLDFDPPRSWLDLLFDARPMASGAGLYFRQKLGDNIESGSGAPALSVACVYIADRIDGLAIGLHGFEFVFLASEPPSPLPRGSLLEGAVYRPGVFEFTGQTTYLFDWGDEHRGDVFQFQWHPTSTLDNNAKVG